MSRRTVQANSIPFIVSPDDLPSHGPRVSLIAGCRLTDELNGLPPAGGVTVSSDVPHAASRAADGGLVVVVGVPRSAFPALSAQNYKALLTVTVDGFVPRSVAVLVPQDPTFPATFTPPPLVALAVRRKPTVIRGRVVRLISGSTTGVAGATVAVTGIWRKPPPPNIAVPPAAPDLVSLAPPLNTDRAAAGGQLAPETLANVLGTDTVTREAVPAGSSPVRLSDRVGVGPGDVLAIDPDDPDRAEYLTVSTITGASTADQPAWFTFAVPPARPHRKGAKVRKVTPAPAGPAAALTDDGWVGDACVFSASVAGFPASGFVRVSGGPGPDGHHRAQTLTAVSDADGYYRLPPLARVAQVEVSAKKGALGAIVTSRPDYSVAENVLNFLIK